MLEKLDGTFPLSAFPKQLQEYIRTARDTLNFPEPFTASVMLLAVAVAIGNTRILKVKEGWMVKPILFLALVGEAGANKSHPISFVLRPLDRINNEHIEAYNKALAEYRKTGDAHPEEKPKPRQILVSDITTEGLVQLHRSNPLRLCLRCDELAGWISNFTRYRKGGDEQLWLSIYSGQPLCVNRKTMDDILSVPEPFICVVGSIQPDILTSTFSGERQSNGFLYRILQARSTGSTKLLWNDKGFPAALERYWDGFLRRILEKCDKDFSAFNVVSDYSFTEDAYFHIQDWQNQWEVALEMEGRPSQVEVYRKIQDYALKFSLILHTMKEAAGIHHRGSREKRKRIRPVGEHRQAPPGKRKGMLLRLERAWKVRKKKTASFDTIDTFLRVVKMAEMSKMSSSVRTADFSMKKKSITP